MMKRLFSSLNKAIKNNKLLILIVVIFLLFNNLPSLTGLYKTFTSDSLVYNGSRGINNPDYFVYISMIELGSQDYFFMKNPYNYEDLRPMMIYPHWYMIGQFSKYTNINPIISYQLFKLLSNIIFIYILWWWLKIIFTKNKNRLIALATVLFSSGAGMIFKYFATNFDLRPTDLHVPESNTFLNLSQNPIFIISQTLLLTIFALFIQKRYWLAAILTFYLALIHPYDAVIIVCLITAWTIIKSLHNPKILLKILYIYLAILPVAIYYYVVFHFDTAAQQWQAQNITTSGNILEYIIGFGMLFILFIIGLIIIIKNRLYKNEYILFLALWAVAGWAMVYLPIDVNRRLANGWHIPIAILSSITICWIYQKIKFVLKSMLISLIIISISFGTLAIIITETSLVYSNDNNLYFNTTYELRVYKFIKNTLGSKTIVLTRNNSGNILPAYTGVSVYHGHKHQTWQSETKNKEVYDLWTSQTDISRWLKDKNIDYIFAQRKYIPEFDDIKWLADESYIEVLIDNNEIILYKVIWPG